MKNIINYIMTTFKLIQFSIKIKWNMLHKRDAELDFVTIRSPVINNSVLGEMVRLQQLPSRYVVDFLKPNVSLLYVNLSYIA